ncbi:hypothetical protein EYF80_023262 [Liparis tanakae]|uniref:Uncharacterized protein n=1 Tax=Liparis tanakae TaxID=230148 RepID=A0A4Z2HL85_9TELE|nr:hypothetical protein EYF80_023262 [Liparis tanakae]
MATGMIQQAESTLTINADVRQEDEEDELFSREDRTPAGESGNEVGRDQRDGLFFAGGHHRRRCQLPLSPAETRTRPLAEGANPHAGPLPIRYSNNSPPHHPDWPSNQLGQVLQITATNVRGQPESKHKYAAGKGDHQEDSSSGEHTGPYRMSS